MMKLHIRFTAVLLLACLAACNSEDMRDSLGLNRKAPDEYRVFSRPALSVPPEFNLRPPAAQGGNEYSSGPPASDQARSQLLSTSAAAGQSPFGSPSSPMAPSAFAPAAPTVMPALAPTAVTPVSTNELPTSADSQFLSNVGANKADPHIRQEILTDAENGAPVQNNPYLLGGKSTADTMVDPAKEAERLKQDKADNKPPTAGDTPVITPPGKGILGDLF